MQVEQLLIKRAQNGDSTALSELLHEHYRFLYHYVLKITMDRGKAEDIVQDTMIRAIEKIRSFQAKGKFSTWLITIASRLIIDKARREKTEQRWLEQERQHIKAQDFVENISFSNWGDVDLAAAVAAMPERLKIPLILKYYYEYTQHEIASMLDIPEGTVKSRLNAGLTELRKELKMDDK